MARILVSSSESSMSQLLERLLGSEGYDVLVADGSSEAIRLLDPASTDVVVFDVTTESSEQQTDVAWLIAILDTTKVVAIMGAALQMSIRRLDRSGRRLATVVKPFAPEVVLGEVERLLHDIPGGPLVGDLPDDPPSGPDGGVREPQRPLSPQGHGSATAPLPENDETAPDAHQRLPPM